MSRIVIACYRPLPGKAAELEALMHTHLPTLKSEHLVTDRPSIMMKAADGTIIEVFEWISQAAIDAAHTNPAVLAMWEKYSACSEYVPAASIAETGQLFSNFAPFGR
ncbi:hypothetical protein DCC81_16730 [Chitinophaga parva]|uniref:ABM domain-containing protein n=1 Tax=Chitinophaga parva TaxID=2169414 RepID=A0A2T7BHZ9_9BACT|nr:hypothetical protein [Chitinophaga parva]PUZ25894.1 hypothetical protein DCC81_16730 [Chitinophaga parva]